MSSQETFGFDGRESKPRRTRQFGVAKPGELLRFRREKADSDSHAHEVLICCGGQEFLCTREMAECFLRKARLTIDSHDAELIPVLHRGGLELLFIAENIPFSVGTFFEHNPHPRDA